MLLYLRRCVSFGCWFFHCCDLIHYMSRRCCFTFAFPSASVLALACLVAMCCVGLLCFPSTRRFHVNALKFSDKSSLPTNVGLLYALIRLKPRPARQAHRTPRIKSCHFFWCWRRFSRRYQVYVPSFGSHWRPGHIPQVLLPTWVDQETFSVILVFWHTSGTPMETLQKCHWMFDVQFVANSLRLRGISLLSAN